MRRIRPNTTAFIDIGGPLILAVNNPDITTSTQVCTETLQDFRSAVKKQGPGMLTRVVNQGRTKTTLIFKQQAMEFSAEEINLWVYQWYACANRLRDYVSRPVILRPEQFLIGFNLAKPRIFMTKLSRSKSGTDCYRSVQNPLISGLSSKNIGIEIQNIVTYFVETCSPNLMTNKG